jgi:hypothetical protein
MEAPRSIEEMNARLERLVEMARTDRKLREALLNDPGPALAKHGIPLAPGIRLRFIETDASEILVPLPRYEGPR